MRAMLLTTAMVFGAAGAAGAAELEIKSAAARVVVIPEARNDVQVSIAPGRAALPTLQVRRQGAGVEIDGGLRRRIEGCNSNGQGQTVSVRGVGRVRVADLPVITARVPLDAAVSADGATYGSVGRTRNLELGSAGCGDWRAADVADRLEVSSAGSGDVSVGVSRRAEVSSAGSGDVWLAPVAGALKVSSAGSGDVRVAAVGGALQASLAGSGDVTVESGRTGPVTANLVGSGDVVIRGAAQSLSASIAGSGDVRVAQVLGPVRRSVVGSGDVIIGR